MLVLILDAKLVLEGAVEGIRLCLWTVLPSLFPFFVVSILISNSLGSGSALLMGYLGGYPIGAQGVMQAYSYGKLSKKDAQRMLAFCNNAGPAFIFGMVSQLFDSIAVGWYLWLITILSSIFVAASAPGKCTRQNRIAAERKPISFPQVIADAVKAMSNVCAWVLLFRIVLTLLQTRVFHGKDSLLQTILFGFLELSNGVVQAASAEDPRIRFVLCAVFLSAGGFCVAMQTHSVTRGLGLHTYLGGKALQTVYALLLSLAAMPAVFPKSSTAVSLISALVCAGLLLLFRFLKKGIAFSEKIVYNGVN